VYGRGQQTVSFGPPVTPDIVKYLLIANVAVFLLQHVMPGLTSWLAVTPALFWQQGFLWQPFTYMWLHSPGSILHIAFNMLALWMFGSPIAMVWGERRFLRFYLLCGIGAGFVIAAWPGLLMLFGVGTPSYVMPTLGASGAVFGVLLAYSFTWPDRTIMLLFPPIPVKAIYFIPFILVLGFLTGPSNVSHIGHLGGVAVAWVLLRRMGVDGGLSLGKLKYRWRRYKMRRQLRAVRMDEMRSKRNDDRTFH
jgi:membrane associated rhomboid family serine protease